ncbi:hypothetical protein D3C86_1239400 [compost metagenome]
MDGLAVAVLDRFPEALRVTGLDQPFSRHAKPEEDRLLADLLLVHGLGGQLGQGVADVIHDAAAMGEAPIQPVRMRSGSQPDEGGVDPVARVMARLEARPGPAGDLVLRESRLGHPGLQGFGHGDLEVLVDQRELPLAVPGPEDGLLLEDQAVDREMLGFQGEGLGDARLPGGHGLARQGVHEIEAEVLDAGFPDGLQGAWDVLGGVVAADSLQQLGIEGLDAQAHAVDAPVMGSLPELGAAGAGVDLHGRLRAGEDAKVAVESRHDRVELAGAEDRGGAPAEVDRLGLEAGVGLDLAREGVHVVVDVLILPRVAGEIAVVALLHAEGDVQVHAHAPVFRGERLHRGGQGQGRSHALSIAPAAVS